MKRHRSKKDEHDNDAIDVFLIAAIEKAAALREQEILKQLNEEPHTVYEFSSFHKKEMTRIIQHRRHRRNPWLRVVATIGLVTDPYG